MKNRLDVLESIVHECGEYARSQQKNVTRSYKPDGSILTEVDLEITKRLMTAIRDLFPDANILTEEVESESYDPQAEYTFIFDPIDGTDTYSQGFASWCVGVGIMDRSRKPVGSMIYAPRFGKGQEDLFLRTDPNDDRIFLNGEPMDLTPFHNGDKDVPKQITTGSRVLDDIPLAKAKVHFRSFGCSLVHIVSILVFSAVDGCLDPRCYLWDIAPAHALALKAGMDFQYWDGEEFTYDDDLYFRRKKFKRTLLVGTPKWREEMRRRLHE